MNKKAGVGWDDEKINKFFSGHRYPSRLPRRRRRLAPNSTQPPFLHPAPRRRKSENPARQSGTIIIKIANNPAMMMMTMKIDQLPSTKCCSNCVCALRYAMFLKEPGRGRGAVVVVVSGDVELPLRVFCSLAHSNCMASSTSLSFEFDSTWSRAELDNMHTHKHQKRAPLSANAEEWCRQGG